MQFFKTGIFLAVALGLSGTAQTVSAQQTNQESFWQTRCAGPSRSAETLICEASQSILQKESGQLVFKIDLIFPAQKGTPVFQMQAPLGFYLPGKIRLAVDGNAMSELDIGTCDKRGCFLSADATPEMIAAMKAGGKLQIDFAPAADRRQTLEVPLAGFSRAVDAIQ
ncbi:invasion associated locus B family protein [Labrenzia sp. 011]|uniref:invasion associated locus B family protein n=1 Tax=Labrenzia sp. 011 TaxID=2171494 RepID=UPI001401F820|nr:invasion associated locus B family protein [Labrenzia sp. 011]